MLISKENLKALLLMVLRQRVEQGCALDQREFTGRIDAAADSYDALYALARELRAPAQRPDWPYREPLEWTEIVAESEDLNPARAWDPPDLDMAAANVEAAFLGSVCGCMLGKPIEVDPSLRELEAAGKACGEWPIRDYISRSFVNALGRRHTSADQTLREDIRFAAADDDIHYTLIGMLLLEENGLQFSHSDIYRTWSSNLPPLWTWGAERTALLATGINHHHLLPAQDSEGDHDVLLLNPGDEMCGALIRADAYGYACPGNPDLAAWLAFKDASFTHTRTGVYGAMFVAALIALCHSADTDLVGGERLQIPEQALRRVPSNTRFAAIVRDSLARVAAAPDWLAAYESIHGQYGQYSHCAIFQEIGTLINTLKFAESIDHGFCLQVSQGNDTDSFGATAGSMLGCFFGAGYLDTRWLQPLHNRLEHGLAAFHEYDLEGVARRLGRLPAATFSEFKQRGIKPS